MPTTGCGARSVVGMLSGAPPLRRALRQLGVGAAAASAFAGPRGAGWRPRISLIGLVGGLLAGLGGLVLAQQYGVAYPTLPATVTALGGEFQRGIVAGADGILQHLAGDVHADHVADPVLFGGEPVRGGRAAGKGGQNLAECGPVTGGDKAARAAGGDASAPRAEAGQRQRAASGAQ